MVVILFQFFATISLFAYSKHKILVHTPYLKSYYYFSQMINESIITVIGLKRAGTAMLMQMLEAGGIDVVVNIDDVYDEHNVNGYYEHNTIVNINYKNPKPYPNDFFEDIKGKAIKVYAGFINLLPKNFNYKFILIERDVAEVWASRLKIQKNKRNSGQFFAIQQREKLQMTVDKVKNYANNNSIEILNLRYAAIINNTESAVNEIAAFLNVSVDKTAMIAAVESSLHKEKGNTKFWVTDRSPLTTAKLIDKYVAGKVYCEIGIGEGHNLNLINTSSKKFGIELNKYGFNRCKALYPHLKIHFGNYLKIYKGYPFDVCFLWIVYPFCKNIVEAALSHNPKATVLMGLNYFYHLKDDDAKKEIYINAYPKQAMAEKWNQQINDHLKELENNGFSHHIEQVVDADNGEIFSVAIIKKSSQ